jgi:DNA modification methylase
MGSGTMGIAAWNNGCNFIGIDNVPEYVEIAETRIEKAQRMGRQLRLGIEADEEARNEKRV